MKNIFITLTGFQITWLSCLLGEYYNYYYLGIIVGTIYIALFFIFNKNRIRSLKIISLFSTIGYFFDSFLALFDLFNPISSFYLGSLPIWFVIIWLSFATLFVNVFSFLKNKYFLSFILGSIFGPSAYYFGIIIDIATTTNIYYFLFIMFLFWGFYLSFYSFIIKRF